MQTVSLNMAVHEGSCLCGWISTIGNNLPVGLKKCIKCVAGEFPVRGSSEKVRKCPAKYQSLALRFAVNVNLFINTTRKLLLSWTMY